MNKINLILIALLFGIVSCDTVDDPIPKDIGQDILYEGVTYVVDPVLGVGNINGLLELIEGNTWAEKNGGDNSTTRFIVLEEFTGHQCIFCPDGTKELLRLDSVYGEQLIPVSIHAGGFAEPSAGKYETDYRVLPHGDIYQNEFDVQGYPTGLVSRIGATVQPKNDWGISIADIEDDSPIVELRMTSYYSQESNIVRVRLTTVFNTAPQVNYNLQLYMLEDNIRDWQKDFSKGDIENYNHRHMLRKVVNGTYGRALENVVVDEEIIIEYILPLAGAWKPGDVEAVAFIFDSDPESYEVIQGNATKIQ